MITDHRSFIDSMPRAVPLWHDDRRDRTLSWLAFALLLAAWNFSDNDAVITLADRPAALAHHGLITVRAARENVI